MEKKLIDRNRRSKFVRMNYLFFLEEIILEISTILFNFFQFSAAAEQLQQLSQFLTWRKFIETVFQCFMCLTFDPVSYRYFASLLTRKYCSFLFPSLEEIYEGAPMYVFFGLWPQKDPSTSSTLLLANLLFSYCSNFCFQDL